MDKKTQLLDENATLEQRRKKDKVALDKVLILKQISLCSSHNIKACNIFIIIVELSCSLQSANSENQKKNRNYVSCGSYFGLKNVSFMK